MSVSFIRATATTASSASAKSYLNSCTPYYDATKDIWPNHGSPSVTVSTGTRFYTPAFTEVKFTWEDLPQNTSGLFLVPQRCSIKAQLDFAAGASAYGTAEPSWSWVPAGRDYTVPPVEAWAVQVTHNWLQPNENWKLQNTIFGYLGQSPSGSLGGGVCFSPTAYKNTANSAAILGGIIPDITDLEAEGYGQNIDGVSLESFRGARDHVFAAMKLTSYNRNRGEPYFRINNIGDIDTDTHSNVLSVPSTSANVGTAGICGQGRIHQRTIENGVAPHFMDMSGYPYTNFSKVNQKAGNWNTGTTWRTFLGNLSYQSWSGVRDDSGTGEGVYSSLFGSAPGNCFPIRANTYTMLNNYIDSPQWGSITFKTKGKSVWNAGSVLSNAKNQEALGAQFSPIISVVDEDKFKPICPLFEGNLPIDLIPNLSSGIYLLLPHLNLSSRISFYQIGLDVPVTNTVTTKAFNTNLQQPYTSESKTDYNSCPMTLSVAAHSLVTSPLDAITTNGDNVPLVHTFVFKELKYTVEFCVVNITSKLQAERLFYLNTLGAVEYVQVPLWLKWNVALEDAEYQQFKPGATAYDLGYLAQKTDETGHIPFSLTYTQISARIQKAMNYRNSSLTVTNIVPVRCMVTSTVPFDYDNFKTMTYSGTKYPSYRCTSDTDWATVPYNIANANGTFVYNNIGPLGAASKMRESHASFASTDDLGDAVTITVGSGGVMDIERRLMNPDAIIPNEQAFSDANTFNDTAVYMTMDCVDGYHAIPEGGSITFSLGVDSWRNSALYLARLPTQDPSLTGSATGNAITATATSASTVLPVPTLIFPKDKAWYAANQFYGDLNTSDFVDFYSRCVEVWLAVRIAIPVISLNPTAAQEVAKAGGRIRNMNDISTNVGHFPIIVR